MRKSRQMIEVGVLALAAAWAGMAVSAFADEGAVVEEKRRSSDKMDVVRRPTADTAKRRFENKTPVEMPFYVFNNRVLPPVVNFSLSGFMGDGSDLKVAGSYTNSLSDGYASMKVQYSAEGKTGWAGAVWQNPANNWGTFDGGYNLTKAKALKFWARGAKGGEIVDFSAGGAAANYPDSDSISTGPIKLYNEWTEYTVHLDKYQMFYIGTGFGFTVKQDKNPYGCVFYLDDVRYE